MNEFADAREVTLLVRKHLVLRATIIKSQNRQLSSSIMTCPTSTMQWNSLHGDQDAGVLSSPRTLPTVVTSIARFDRICNSREERFLETPKKEASLGEEKASCRRGERRRYRRRRDIKPKGILKKTSSYNGLSLLKDDSEECDPPKKRVSFPGLSSCRWDSQSSTSQSLGLPGCLRRRDPSEERHGNKVWKANKRCHSPPPPSLGSSVRGNYAD